MEMPYRSIMTVFVGTSRNYKNETYEDNKI